MQAFLAFNSGRPRASLFLPPYFSWPALCQPRTPDSCATSAPALSMGLAGPLAGARRGQLSQN